MIDVKVPAWMPTLPLPFKILIFVAFLFLVCAAVAYVYIALFQTKLPLKVNVQPREFKYRYKNQPNDRNELQYEYRLVIDLRPTGNETLTVTKIKTTAKPSKNAGREIWLGVYEQHRDWENFDLYPGGEVKQLDKKLYLNLRDINYLLGQNLIKSDMERKADDRLGGYIDIINPQMKGYILQVEIEYHVAGNRQQVQIYQTNYRAQNYDQFMQIKSEVMR